jgi:hypothetical protein
MPLFRSHLRPPEKVNIGTTTVTTDTGLAINVGPCERRDLASRDVLVRTDSGMPRCAQTGSDLVENQQHVVGERALPQYVLGGVDRGNASANTLRDRFDDHRCGIST